MLVSYGSSYSKVGGKVERRRRCHSSGDATTCAVKWMRWVGVMSVWVGEHVLVCLCACVYAYIGAWRVCMLI